MKQDIIPYSQIRRHRIRSDRPVARRSVSVVSFAKVPNQPVEIMEVDTYIWEPAPMTRPIEALTSEEKVQVLERALVRARMAAKAERRRGFRRRVLN